MRKFAVAVLTLALVTPVLARAEGLDRDALLTEAPATPHASTIRITAGATGQTTDPGNSTQIAGDILWAPIDRVAADVGTYWQNTENGPTVRLRVQVLSQQSAGVDLALGARFKKIGFFTHPTDGSPNGELEFLVALGRRIGALDLILNGVFGTETGGPGKDLEAKAFVGYRVLENLRVGIDSRLQAEFVDEAGVKTPQSTDMDLTAGPALSWILFERLQLQALLGVAKPRGTTTATGAGLLLASMDF